MPKIGAVADDLTGATTTGVLLARSKAKTAVFFNEQAALKAEGMDNLDAVIISTSSRPLPGEEAYKAVSEATKALQNMGVTYFSKRIDTTLRGGVGVEIDAMMDTIGNDVQAIARACVQLHWNVLAVDPGAFTAKLAYSRGLIQAESANVPENTLDGQGKTVLIAAGSASPVTKKQMEVLCEDPRHVRISIDPTQLIEGGVAAEAVAKGTVAEALELLEQETPPRAILLETALHGVLLDLDKEDSDRGYYNGQCADMINAYLGQIVRMIIDQKREQIVGLYCTGGDTEVNVCDALDVQCLEVVDYVIAQTDIGRLTGKYAGIPIIGKGGLTGTDTIVLDIVDRLFKEATR